MKQIKDLYIDKEFLKKVIDKEFDAMSLTIKRLIEKTKQELYDKIMFEKAFNYCKTHGLINNND